MKPLPHTAETGHKESCFWTLFFILTENTDYTNHSQQTAFISAIEHVGHRLGYLCEEDLGGHREPTHRINQTH